GSEWSGDTVTPPGTARSVPSRAKRPNAGKRCEQALRPLAPGRIARRPARPSCRTREARADSVQGAWAPLLFELARRGRRQRRIAETLVEDLHRVTLLQPVEVGVELLLHLDAALGLDRRSDARRVGRAALQQADPRDPTGQLDPVRDLALLQHR